jgi:hypothetical protein
MQFSTDISIEYHSSMGEVVNAKISRPGGFEGDKLFLEYGASGSMMHEDTVGKIRVPLAKFVEWLLMINNSHPSPHVEPLVVCDGGIFQIEVTMAGRSFSLSWWAYAPDSWKAFESVTSEILDMVLESCGLTLWG